MSLSVYLGSNWRWASHGVVNLNPGDIAIAANGALRSVSIQQRDDEVIDTKEPAFDLLPVGRRDRNGHRLQGRRTAATSTAARHQEVVLKLLGIRETRADALEVTGYGMAGGAGGFEVRFALRCVAHQNAGRDVARGVIARDPETVNIRGHVSNLRRSQVDLGHFAAAVLNDRRDEFAVLIVENQIRTKQIRSAFAAAGVGAVTEVAVDAVEPLTAFDRRRISGLTLRKCIGEPTSAALLRRPRRGTAPRPAGGAGVCALAAPRATTNVARANLLLSFNRHLNREWSWNVPVYLRHPGNQERGRESVVQVMREKRANLSTVRALAILLWLSAVAAAQTPPGRTDCAADGSVVNAGTGEPIPRARVTAIATQVSVVADNAGRWAFSGLICGRGDIFAIRPGFLKGTVGRAGDGTAGPFTLISGTPAHDLVIKLAPQAVVTGQGHQNESGDPRSSARRLSRCHRS